MRIGLAWFDLTDPTDRTVAENLSRALARRGHQVFVAGPKQAKTPARLEAFHRRHAVEVWHCHVFARDHRVFAQAARRGRWPVVATLHLVLQDYLRFVGGRRGMARLLRTASRVTTVSRASRREFTALFPGYSGRIFVVPNGTRAVAAGGGGATRPYALNVARLAPYKGQDVLVMAFAKALERRPDLRLVLCGRDQTKGGLRRLVGALGLDRHVTLTGGLPSGRVDALLRGCSFFVLPSRRENQPMALLEAMAAGKPVLASATGGIPEMVRDRKDGLLVAPGDPERLADRMVELAGDPRLRRRLGKAAFERSRAFTWEKAARAYEGLYARAVASARRSSGTRSKK